MSLSKLALKKLLAKNFSEFFKRESILKSITCSSQINNDFVGKIILTDVAAYYFTSKDIVAKKRIRWTDLKDITYSKNSIEFIFNNGISSSFYSFVNIEKTHKQLMEIMMNPKYNEIRSQEHNSTILPSITLTKTNCSSLKLSKSNESIFDRSQGDLKSELDNSSINICLNCKLEGELLFEEDFPYNLTELEEILFDPSCNFLDKCREKQMIYDYSISKFEPSEDGNMIATSTYKVNNVVFGKSAYVNSQIFLLKNSNYCEEHHDYLINVYTRGVPFSDSIVIKQFLCLRKKSDDTTSMKVTLTLEFIKSISVLFRSKVEKETLRSTKEKSLILATYLKYNSEESISKNLLKINSSTTKDKLDISLLQGQNIFYYANYLIDQIIRNPLLGLILLFQILILLILLFF